MSRPDVPTVFAVGAVVYVGAKIAHEAVGHGGACLAVEGDWIAVSSAWSLCERAQDSVSDGRVVKAAGTLVNLAVGALALAWLRLWPPGSGAPRLALFLTAAVHLFMGGGYLMVDPLFGFGDWTAFLIGLTPGLAWKIGLVLGGVVISVVTLQLLRHDLDAFLGPGATEQRRPIARWVCVVPYLAAGGVLLSVGALFNDQGVEYAISSALATLGGTCWLAWLPAFVHERSGGPPAVPVARSGIWLVLGGAAVLFELFAFGPGIHLG